MPRRSAGLAAHFIGLVVANEFLGGGIKSDFAAELPTDGRGVAREVAIARDHLVCRRSAAGFDTVEEIPDVPCGISS